MDSFIYIPGNEPEKSAPLARFLPPVPQGIAAAFLAQNSGLAGLERGAWILDPFGASPQLAVEVARQGYRILVAVNNPVTRFLLEMAANPPSPADLSAGLAELAAARKGIERLEIHLQSLYVTNCVKCQRKVPADAFIWDRTSGSLTGRIYHCPCGEGGEYPATEADQMSATSLAATDNLHRARALERVTSPDDPDRQHAVEALECYLPRAVYSLITIINKLDSLVLTSARKRALLALVLTAFDDGSALWSHPPERPRPKQLTLPAHFLEKNIWQAMERGVELWSGSGNPIEVTTWPKLPGDAGGVCLFEGPMRDLSPRIKDLFIAAVVTTLPRPNQAFWTLSALWAGWLWGKEAVAPFKSVLRRRRYDWNWHAEALHATLKSFTDQMPLNAPLFTMIPELEPAFLSAAMLAAAAAGLDIIGLALRARQDPAQILWSRRAFAHEVKEPVDIDNEEIRNAMKYALVERAEPMPLIFMHAAGLTAMVASHALRWQEDALAQINTSIQAALAGPEFVHYSESPNPESGLWALAEWDRAVEPLPDQVEIAVVSYLQHHPACIFRDIETALNSKHTGLQTPSLGLIRAVLVSYAIETSDHWNMRPEDSPAARLADLETATHSLSVLGTKLGYTLHRTEKNGRLVQWLENGEIKYNFTLLGSAVVGRILRQDPMFATNNFLVIPGGRAGLLAYKFNRDATLRHAAENWRILKFRQLRRLDGLTGLTLAQLEREFSSDPIEPPEQMKLF